MLIADSGNFKLSAFLFLNELDDDLEGTITLIALVLVLGDLGEFLV